MTDHDLPLLLMAAAVAAERSAPCVDPLAALATSRRRQGQRRGHLAALAFVVFVLLLQASPPDALGADRAYEGPSVASADATEDSRVGSAVASRV